MTDASGLDLLEQNPDLEGIAQARAEERRQSAIQLVNSIYRLIRVLGIHAESNQAVAVLVNGLVQAVTDFCEKAGASSASVLFADDTIFVNGQMLRASRDGYATAVALGGLFTRCGISEATFQSSLEAAQAMEFARALHAALRDRSLAATTVERVIPGVKLRRIDGRTKDGEDLDEIPLTQRVAHTYAASVVILRALHDELAAGNFQLPQRIKRVAQKLVKDAEDAPHILLSLTTARASGGDEASLAVASASLSVLMARKLTSDRAMLGNLATTALLFDVGRHDLGAKDELLQQAGISRTLNDDELDRLPARSAAVLTVLGRMHTASITRTVVTFEALWARRAARLGPLYGGRRTPTMLARILTTARTFIELVTPTKSAPALAIDDAVHLMMDTAASEIDRASVKLLVATLGFFPVGTVVELNTGELAIVTAVPQVASEFARPPVRLMYDDSGNLLGEPVDLDLASETNSGAKVRYVRRTIEYDAQQMRAMRAFILQTVSGKRPAQHPALLRPTSEPAASSDEAETRPITGSRKLHLTPAPRKMPASPAPSQGPATRQVSWEEYKALATPQPRIVSAPTAVVSHSPAEPQPKPAPSSATRQVSWEEYKALATPQPRIVAAETAVAKHEPATAVVEHEAAEAPKPKPVASATRQVSWDEYKAYATPQPRIVASPPAQPGTREVSWEDYEETRTSSLPPEPASDPSATRAVDWNQYEAIASAPEPSPKALDPDPIELPPWSDDIPIEQDDTDLLLAGVDQDEELPPKALPGSNELDSLFKSYLDDEPVPPSSEPAPKAPPIFAPPVSPTPTRHVRWAATEAMLSELDKEAAQQPKRSLPPRPEPKRPPPPRPAPKPRKG